MLTCSVARVQHTSATQFQGSKVAMQRILMVFTDLLVIDSGAFMKAAHDLPARLVKSTQILTRQLLLYLPLHAPATQTTSL